MRFSNTLAEISRTKRQTPPANYSLKVHSYSLLSEAEEYESGAFESDSFNGEIF